VSKRLASRYSSGPSHNWCKSKCPDWKKINAGRHKLFEGPQPYENDHFDVVVSNQVFEHISGAELRQVLEKTSRVLKPGGFLLALFPRADVWFEGHLGVMRRTVCRNGQGCNGAILPFVTF
jgi:SAM-dependent methyltransferase